MAHERKDVKGRKDAFARELGARLREAREKAGLNQAQMAALAGVSETALGNYERGKRLAPIDVVLRIAEVTGSQQAEVIGTASGYQAKEERASRYAVGVNKDLQSGESPRPRITGVGSQAIDRALLAECIVALMQTDFYAALQVEAQASAIAALYDLAAATGERPRSVLRGRYEGEEWERSSTSRGEKTGS